MGNIWVSVKVQAIARGEKSQYVGFGMHWETVYLCTV